MPSSATPSTCGWPTRRRLGRPTRRSRPSWPRSTSGTATTTTATATSTSRTATSTTSRSCTPVATRPTATRSRVRTPSGRTGRRRPSRRTGKARPTTRTVAPRSAPPACGSRTTRCSRRTAGCSVFAHEYAHDLGLPDDYDTTGAGDNPIEQWTLMAQSRLSGRGRRGHRDACRRHRRMEQAPARLARLRGGPSRATAR